jgi:outer membrane protein OmpA-like peptidoglycan-associated protein
VPLYEARKALDRVAEADDPAELDHQVYMTRRYLDIAQEETASELAEAQVQQLAQERDRLQLTGREQQVEELEAELAALEAERTDRGILVTLQDVLFQTNRATLEPGAERSLSAIAQYLEKHPEREVVIEGHTDARGPEDYNRQLSQRRAESVKEALVGRGVPEERIEARGLGESTPVASNDNPTGRQLNRRVEVVILDTGGR